MTNPQKIELRAYQKHTIDLLYSYLSERAGNPCIVLPTGAGKSHVIAHICKDAIQNWPDTRVLMITHVSELISQNAEKLREHWPGAPLGVYSAGLGQRVLDEPITFGGIQSLRKRADDIGHVDIIIIDECHLVSHKDEGGYRSLIAGLTEINPRIRVIGLTATPWRMGHGLITDGDSIFEDLIEPTTIEELVLNGFLAPLHSKQQSLQLSVEGVKKRGGDYIERQLQKAVDTEQINSTAVSEIIDKGQKCLHWLIFCAGVEHAEHVANELASRGVSAATLSGKTTKKERSRIISEFKSGKIRALTNCNVLTTGFDFPDIDLIAFLRPTLSPVLYMQMAGRGLRLKSHTEYCVVLDFAGIIMRHGPITCVRPPKKKGDKPGEAPAKVCKNCHEIVPISARVCPTCGEQFPEQEGKDLNRIHNDDIMGIEGSNMEVLEWSWHVHTSNAGNKMLKVDYYGCLSDPAITEYLTVLHKGDAGRRALITLNTIRRSAGVDHYETLEEQAAKLTLGEPPREIEYKRDGCWNRVIRRSWPPKQMEITQTWSRCYA